MWEGAIIGGTVKDYLSLPHSRRRSRKISYEQLVLSQKYIE